MTLFFILKKINIVLVGRLNLNGCSGLESLHIESPKFQAWQLDLGDLPNLGRFAVDDLRWVDEDVRAMLWEFAHNKPGLASLRWNDPSNVLPTPRFICQLPPDSPLALCSERGDGDQCFVNAKMLVPGDCQSCGATFDDSLSIGEFCDAPVAPPECEGFDIVTEIWRNNRPRCALPQVFRGTAQHR